MKKSFRTTYWFLASIFKRYAGIIIASLIVSVVFTLNIERIILLLPKSSTIYIGRIGSYDLSQLPLDIQQQISSGLTKIDDNGEPQPDLASSWNIQESGRLYRFVLDTTRTWQDGKSLTVDDIELALSDVEIETDAENNVIIFRLKDAFAPFPTVMSQPLFRKVNYKQYLFLNRTKIIGTNDFSITSIETKGGVITKLTLKSPIETKIYRFYPTEEDAITAFMLGHIDKIEGITNTQTLTGWENLTITPVNHTDRYVALFFNTQDPNLSSKSIRQGLAYAMPKNQYPRRAISPINPKSWAYNPQVKPYHQDLTQSKELLTTSLQNGSLDITLTTTPTFVTEAETIIQSWRDVGVNAQLQVVNFPDTNNYQALLIGQYVPKDPDQYTYWHSTQPTNFTRYNNPRIDKLLEDGRKTIDEDERTLIYQDFQRFLIEDTPAVFLHYLDSFTVERN